jgi:hypothetical protein
MSQVVGAHPAYLPETRQAGRAELWFPYLLSTFGVAPKYRLGSLFTIYTGRGTGFCGLTGHQTLDMGVHGANQGSQHKM